MAIFALVVIGVTVTALVERWAYLDRNDQWMRETEQALASNEELQELIATIESLPPGRVYAGIRTGFSDDIKVGSLRIPDILAFHQIETAAPPYQSLSLNSDLIWHFDHNNPAHYEVFNARYVVLPRNLETPEFLTPITVGDRYQLLEAPSGGYLGLAETPVGYEGSEAAFHIAARAWFMGGAPEHGVYPALAIPDAPRLDGLAYLPMTGASSEIARLRPQDAPDERGAVLNEIATPFDYRATVRVDVASTLLLKATFHPDWRVYVDGAEVEPFMVAPSFPGIHLEPGTYAVEFVYKANALRTPLLGLALATLWAIAIVEWKQDWLRDKLRGLRS